MCRRKSEKDVLFRFVCDIELERVVWDPGVGMSGRGMYVHRSGSCLTSRKIENLLSANGGRRVRRTGKLVERVVDLESLFENGLANTGKTGRRARALFDSLGLSLTGLLKNNGRGKPPSLNCRKSLNTFGFRNG